MRSFEGQHSDNVAIKRTREQKQRQLLQLKEQLAMLKSHAAPAIRDALVKRLAELEAELRQPEKPARENRVDAPRPQRRENRPSVFRADDGGANVSAGTTAGFASPRRRS